VACEFCRDYEENDDILPDCKNGKGCIIFIDKLGTYERIILEAYYALHVTAGIIDSQTIISRYGFEEYEIDLLIALIRIQKEEENQKEAAQDGKVTRST
jgi:hypothetical protein